MRRIQTKADLYALKHISGADAIEVDLSSLKLLGLAHAAIRLAFFAVRADGQIILKDSSASSEQSIGPYRIGWPSLRALAVRALSKDCRRERTDDASEMRFTRLTQPLGSGWSAGVIFSGNEAELPALGACLDGLLAQPELTGKDGEILVCGPPHGEALLNSYQSVKYIFFENPHAESGAFPISLKKNALMKSMRYPRKLVLHARMVLSPGALSAVPKEFDIIAPNVIWKSEHGTEANIGLVSIDPGWPAMVPRRFELNTMTVAPEKYLDLMAHGRPFADGGAFAVTNRVLAECELLPDLLWGDCEDVEWCFRAQTLGFLVDMCEGMEVESQKSKVRTLEMLPSSLARAVRRARRVMRYATGALRRG